MAPEVDASELEQRILALREATNAQKQHREARAVVKVSEQTRAGELEVAESAVRELRIVAEASNSEALRAKATQLEADAKEAATSA